jgi:hypothetical protein
MIHDYEEPWWNDTDRRKLKNSGKNLSHCHFVHHKSHVMDMMNPGLCCERLAADRLSHGTVHLIHTYPVSVNLWGYLTLNCSVVPLYRDMFCAGRVPDEDLRRTMKACGGSVMSTAHDLSDSVLGRCDYFEERQVGGERYFNITCIYILVVWYVN